MHRFAAALILAACWAGSSAGFAQSRSGAIAVEHKRQTFVSTVRVTAADGKVAGGDVFRGMSRAYGYDGRALGGALPNWSVRLHGRTARLMAAGFNRTEDKGDILLIGTPGGVQVECPPFLSAL